MLPRTRQRVGTCCWLALVLLAGCARGGDGDADGGTLTPRDSGTTTRRDGGGGGGCDERGGGADCESAASLGPVAVGARVESDEGLIGRVGVSQWLRVDFPPESAMPADAGAPSGDGGVPDAGPPSMAGVGTPSIRFSDNGGDAYRFEIRTSCGTVAGCGEGGSPSAPGSATNITEWSFTDAVTAGDEGDGALSSRDAPWPSTVWIRVYPTTAPDCSTYRLEVTR